MSTVLPRYSFYVWLFGLFRLSRVRMLCGAVASVSLLVVLPLVSLVRGQTTGPALIAPSTSASANVAPAPASKLQIPAPAAAAVSDPGNAKPMAAAPSAAAPGAAAATAAGPIVRCAAALTEAQRVLDGVTTMRALMEKRERVRGQLEPAQRIDLKVRRSPRSVYMRWQTPDEGQEVIWQENANGNRILVHPGGWRGRLMPMVKVDPKSPRVSEQSRRPIESAGLWTMSKQLHELMAEAQQSPAEIQVEVADNVNFAGRNCTQFRLIRHAYRSPADFQKIVFYIDSSSKVPVGFERYVWPAGGRGEPMLDEYYAYRDLRLNPPLSNRDFDAANPAYHFSASETDREAESIGSKAGPTIK